MKLIIVVILLLGCGPGVASHPIEELRMKVWRNYCEEQSKSQGEENSRYRYATQKVGEAPEEGYPVYIALHGGGGCGAWVNDSQWEHMKVYYADSVESGLYITPRGLTDTWDLHFVEDSYAMYEWLIHKMLVEEGADPNRVYILGFSSGGDGTYQIAARSADRWAAANMSAGHSNWVSLVNLHNLPFLMQMGQYDGAYDRNHNVVQSYETLLQLQDEFGGYACQVNLHVGGSHNSWSDNDPRGAEKPVLADPVAWAAGQDSAIEYRNTNAIHWLSQHVRNPYPQQVIWDADCVEVHSKRCFYWLDASENAPEQSLGRIRVHYEGNDIYIDELQPGLKLGLLLNEQMVDFDKPLCVWTDGKELATFHLQASESVMRRTLALRRDPAYIFAAELLLECNELGEWTASQK